MIYELRTYTLYPGGLAPWLKLYEEHAIPIFETIQTMQLIGYFRTETGVLNRVLHLWAYPDKPAREEAFRTLEANPSWLPEFVLPARPYLLMQESTLLSPVSFSPLK